MQRQSGKVDVAGWTALLRLFHGNAEKVAFGSIGFKLLWKKEKDIKVSLLKEKMQAKLELKEKVVAAVPDAAAYYE